MIPSYLHDVGSSVERWISERSAKFILWHSLLVAALLALIEPSASGLLGCWLSPKVFPVPQPASAVQALPLCVKAGISGAKRFQGLGAKSYWEINLAGNKSPVWFYCVGPERRAFFLSD